MVLIPTPKAIRERSTRDVVRIRTSLNLGGSNGSLLEGGDNSTYGEETSRIMSPLKQSMSPLKQNTNGSSRVSEFNLSGTTSANPTKSTPNSPKTNNLSSLTDPPAQFNPAHYTVGGVYCASVSRGSPAAAADILGSGFALEKIDNHIVPDDFEKFLELLRKHYSSNTSSNTDSEGGLEIDHNIAAGSPEGSFEPQICHHGLNQNYNRDFDHRRNSKKVGPITNYSRGPSMTSRVTRVETIREDDSASKDFLLQMSKKTGGPGPGSTKARGSPVTSASNCTTPRKATRLNNKTESYSSTTNFNERFTRVMLRDLEGRQYARTLLRNDKFYPALSICRLADGTFKRESL